MSSTLHTSYYVSKNLWVANVFFWLMVLLKGGVFNLKFTFTPGWFSVVVNQSKGNDPLLKPEIRSKKVTWMTWLYTRMSVPVTRKNSLMVQFGLCASSTKLLYWKRGRYYIVYTIMIVWAWLRLKGISNLEK